MTRDIRPIHGLAAAAIALALLPPSGAGAADIHEMIRASILGTTSVTPVSQRADETPVDMQELARRSILGLGQAMPRAAQSAGPGAYDAQETARRQILGLPLTGSGAPAGDPASGFQTR
jgi:hypothetical protein